MSHLRTGFLRAYQCCQRRGQYLYLGICCLGEGRCLHVSWQAFLIGTGLYQPLRVENMIYRAQDGLESVVVNSFIEKHHTLQS